MNQNVPSRDLSELYEQLAALIYDRLPSRIRSIDLDDDKQKLARIVRRYGVEDVTWMLGVIRGDIAAGRSAS